MKKIVIGNWKMMLAPTAGRNLANDLVKLLPAKNSAEVVVCPSFTALELVGEAIKDSQIELGAQDVFWQDSGAYTGEESPASLVELGCQYVIIGHSERRQGLGETDQMVHNKAATAIEQGLWPIVCVGETYEERHNGKAEAVVHRQLTSALQGVDLVGSEQLVIAYEPVWAIGRGQPITIADAQLMVQIIHQALLDVFPLTIVQGNVRIVYGGSVNATVAQEFANIEHLAGFLVGGASVKADQFVDIIKQSI